MELTINTPLKLPFGSKVTAVELKLLLLEQLHEIRRYIRESINHMEDLMKSEVDIRFSFTIPVTAIMHTFDAIHMMMKLSKPPYSWPYLKHLTQVSDLVRALAPKDPYIYLVDHSCLIEAITLRLEDLHRECIRLHKWQQLDFKKVEESVEDEITYLRQFAGEFQRGIDNFLELLNSFCLKKRNFEGISSQIELNKCVRAVVGLVNEAAKIIAEEDLSRDLAKRAEQLRVLLQEVYMEDKVIISLVTYSLYNYMFMEEYMPRLKVACSGIVSPVSSYIERHSQVYKLKHVGAAKELLKGYQSILTSLDDIIINLLSYIPTPSKIRLENIPKAPIKIPWETDSQKAP